MRIQESMIGDSVALADALARVSALAPIHRPVLVLGERGTGKELIGQRLHYLSPRWDAPLLKVNCAAMAETLLESELFGHEAGAFTGATRLQRGRFERADGGTLFLDELGTMSARLQEKLLRLVEYGEFERVGGQQTLQVDVRVVAATHADLRALVDEGRFRADLLDRLSFDVVHLPPLRVRHGDIELLATHFAVGMTAELGWDVFPGFTDSAVQTLESHAWPGNIRELKNVVERSLYRWGDPDNPIDEVIIDVFTAPFEDHRADPRFTVADSDGEENRSRAPHAPAAPQTTEPLDFTNAVETYEKQLVQRALASNGQHQGRAAQSLGLSYDQMRRLVRKYDLSRRTRQTRG